MKVNGTIQHIDAEPDTPLLWVLRDELRMKGTKYGCGIGACGACTVLLDGHAIRSCVTTVSAVGERDVRTIEDADHAVFNALRAAWQVDDVPQCGYCQPAQIAGAAALLLDNVNPTRAAMDEAMRGIICRCGTYTRIRAAIERAAQQLQTERTR